MVRDERLHDRPLPDAGDGRVVHLAKSAVEPLAVELDDESLVELADALLAFADEAPLLGRGPLP